MAESVKPDICGRSLDVVPRGLRADRTPRRGEPAAGTGEREAGPAGSQQKRPTMVSITVSRV